MSWLRSSVIAAALCAALPLTLAPAHAQVLVRAWGAYGTGAGQFDRPFDIGVDAIGNVYVLDQGNDRVQKFSAEGEFILEFGSTGSAPGQLDQPYGIGVAANGHVWTVDPGLNRLTEFDENGQYVRMIQTPYSWDTGMLDAPTDVAVDVNGNLWIVDWGSRRMLHMSPSGVELSRWFHENYEWCRVVLDANGDVYVAHPQAWVVQRYSPAGTLLYEYHSYGEPTNMFMGVGGLALDAAGNLYVTRNYIGAPLVKISPDGTVLSQWGARGEGPDRITEPWAITVGPQDEVWATDVAQNRVYKYAQLPVPTQPTTWGRLKSLYR